MKQPVVVGTTEGAYRVDSDIVTPLGAGLESVTALAQLPGGEFLAGTSAGQLWHSSEQGGAWRELWPPEDHPVLDIQVASRRADHALVLMGDGTLFGCDPGAGHVRELLLAATFDAPRRRGSILTVPGRSSLVLLCGDREPLRSSAPPFERTETIRLPADAITSVTVHPADPSIWIAAGGSSIYRSTDGGRSFAAIRPGLEEGRQILFESLSPYRLFLLAEDPPIPAVGDEPSSLRVSRDAGQSFDPYPCHLVDRLRDPSGSITAICIDSRGHALFYGTDRGELLAVHLLDLRVEKRTDDLPPIQTLLLGRTSSRRDPAASGVYVLP